jgi:hypothetical protein
MVKKLYICRECGHVYPEELSEYIENEIQVYCEMCGTPFSLVGVKFKQVAPTPPKASHPPIPPKAPRTPYSLYGRSDNNKPKLSNVIKAINKISYLPLLIFAGIVLGLNFQLIFYPHDWLTFLIKSLIIGFSALLITIYDINYISPKIKEERYDEIALDAFCYGILGCIIFGTGVILLIKGILIIIYLMANAKEEKNRIYYFGLKLKNSINRFSAKAGIIIIFLTVFIIFDNFLYFQYFQSGLFFIFNTLGGLALWLRIIIITAIIAAICLIPVIILLIDFRMSKKIAEKQIFTLGDALRVFILGIFGTALFGIGIFILLKGILLFLLFVGKPLDETNFATREAPIYDKTYKTSDLTPQAKIPSEMPLSGTRESKIRVITKDEEPHIPVKDEITPGILPKSEEEIKQEGIILSEEGKITKEEPKEEYKEEHEVPEEEFQKSEIKLKLHESLLPVKNEKDKKLVREYFSKIFNVLSKDLRDQIMDLNIPKKDRNQLLKELAFLNKQEQEKYIRAIIDLYKQLPVKLIERIRKLPNIKPQYYEKIIEQLKFMDYDEQVEFVHFLEKNA